MYKHESIVIMSLTQLTLVCTCEQKISDSNRHPCIYYDTVTKKKKKHC